MNMMLECLYTSSFTRVYTPLCGLVQ